MQMHPPLGLEGTTLPHRLPTRLLQVSDVRRSLLVTGFGYEHDEAWAANMELFKEFTDVCQVKARACVKEHKENNAQRQCICVCFTRGGVDAGVIGTSRCGLNSVGDVGGWRIVND